MSDSRCNSLLNDLLIELHCGLPQYIGVAWPWTSDQGGELKQIVQRLVDQQQAGVARLTRILQERGHDIDFGTYPQEYTSLHYVALEYLLSSLKSTQQGLTDWIGTLLPELQADPQAEQAVLEIAESQRLSMQELNAVRLTASPSAVAWMK